MSDLGQVAPSLSLSPFFLYKWVNIPQGSKAISNGNNPTLCGTPRGTDMDKPHAKGPGWSRALQLHLDLWRLHSSPHPVWFWGGS